MATFTKALTATDYTLLDSGTDTAQLVQNRGSANVFIIFSASAPSVSDEDHFYLKPGQGIQRGSMTGNMYALAETGEGAKVTVGE